MAGPARDGMGWTDVDSTRPFSRKPYTCARWSRRSAYCRTGAEPGTPRSPKIKGAPGRDHPEARSAAVRSSGSDFLQGTPGRLYREGTRGTPTSFIAWAPALRGVSGAAPGPWCSSTASRLDGSRQQLDRAHVVPLPVRGALTTRSHLQRQSRMDPKERLQSYRRWRAASSSSRLRARLRAFAVGVGKARLPDGAVASPFFLIAYLAPASNLSLGPTDRAAPGRDAWPQRRDLPWYKAAGTDVFHWRHPGYWSS
jgi:hypothetical protein